MGIVPVVLHHSTICEIATIQINMPNNHREDSTCKTIELMYFEIMKRFNYGKDLKTLHPIQDMEIEHNPAEDDEPEEMDIKKLVEAQENIEEELVKPEIAGLAKENIEDYERKT